MSMYHGETDPDQARQVEQDFRRLVALSRSDRSYVEWSDPMVVTVYGLAPERF